MVARCCSTPNAATPAARLLWAESSTAGAAGSPGGAGACGPIDLALPTRPHRECCASVPLSDGEAELRRRAGHCWIGGQAAPIRKRKGGHGDTAGPRPLGKRGRRAAGRLCVAPRLYKAHNSGAGGDHVRVVRAALATARKQACDPSASPPTALTHRRSRDCLSFVNSVSLFAVSPDAGHDRWSADDDGLDGALCDLGRGGCSRVENVPDASGDVPF